MPNEALVQTWPSAIAALDDRHELVLVRELAGALVLGMQQRPVHHHVEHAAATLDELGRDAKFSL